MKKLALILTAIAAFSGSALAADLPMKAPAAVPPVPVWSWTGFYLGGNVGYLIENDQGNTFFTQPAATFVTGQQFNAASRSFVGGVQGGYNWQVSSWVLGIEADWDWTNSNYGPFCRTADAGPPCSDAGRGFLNFSGKTEWLASVRGRVGWTWNQFFVYATGGGAWGRVDTTISSNCLVAGCGNNAVTNALTASFGNNRSGWVAGLGTEFVISGNWTGRVEWLHYDLGNLTTTLVAPATFGSYTASYSRSLQYDTFRVGVDYKFAWGAPLVAKY
jgi:outer membrane immunogenic protein